MYWFRNLSPLTIDSFDETDAENLVKIVPGLNDSLLLFQEMKQLSSSIIKCFSISEVANTFKTHFKFYPHASLLYQFVLTLSITVSSNERSFSKLKLIKSYLRSTMDNERLFYLIISSIECDLIDQTNIQELVNDWTKMKDRRLCTKS